MKEVVNKAALALYDVQEFKTWLSFEGWTIEKIQSENEVVRATRNDFSQPLVIYRHIYNAIFAIVSEIWYDIVCQFYTKKKKLQRPVVRPKLKKSCLNLLRL